MSRRHRSRTSRQSLPPSSPIASEAASSAPLKLVTADPEVEIRYAETEDDVIAMHKFLLVVASPSAVDGINVVKSLQELIRVSKEGVALMAVSGGVLVATLGLMKVQWWYNDTFFMTDRWHFCLPDFWHGEADKKLMEEAKAIANQAGLRFVDNGKLRDGHNGVLRMTRRLYSPDQPA